MEKEINKIEKIEQKTFNKFIELENLNSKLNEICRICLTRTNETDHKLHEKIDLLNNSEEIKSLLEVSTGVQIAHLDLLPNHICSLCFKILAMWYRFRSQAKHSDEILKTYLKKQNYSLSGSSPLTNTVALATIPSPNKQLTVDPVENVHSPEDSVPQQNNSKKVDDSYQMTRSKKLSLDKQKYQKPLKTKPWNCEHCLKTYACRVSLYDHQKRFHQDSFRCNYQCDVCKKHYNRHKSLIQHKSKPCIPVEILEQYKIQKSDIIEPAQLTAIADKVITNTKISCSLCKKIFKSHTYLIRHFPRQHKNDKKCQICQKVFRRAKLLESHVRIHLRLKNYPCPMCSRWFYEVAQFRVHIKAHSKREWVYRCNVCEKEFFRLKEFESHMVKHLEDDPSSLDKAKANENKEESHDVKQPLEISKNPKDSELDSNIDIEHLLQLIKAESPEHSTEDIPMEENSINVAQLKSEASPPKSIVKLETTDLVNSSNSGDDNDIEIDDELPTSTKSTSHPSGKHLSEDTLRLLDKCKLKCHVAGCQANLTNSIEVWDHLKVEHYNGKTPPFTCTKCDQTFKKKNDLRLHLRKYYSYKCPCCKKVYPSSWALKTHVIRAHSKDRPYQCSKCDRKFLEQSARKVHEQSHANTKEFICSLCSKEFFSSSGLYLHSKSHKDIKELQCPICGRQFPIQSVLKQHMKRNSCGQIKKKRRRNMSMVNMEHENASKTTMTRKGQEPTIDLDDINS